MKTLLNILLLSFFIGCVSEKSEFIEWKKQSDETLANNFKIDTASFYSHPLLIDTIYRSMQGPYVSQKIQISSQDDDLVYIVGYQSEVLDAVEDTLLPSKFMCHNNLNYLQKQELPWKLKTSGANSRIFTLSEGQTDLSFPKGYGIPVKANHPFEMVSQVLNHLEEDINLKAKHKVSLAYAKESKKDPIIPLYQQSVFVTQQIEGPKGIHGLPLSCVDHIHKQENISNQEEVHDCSIIYEKGEYNPYQDQYGRKFSGHWKLPIGKQELRTDVTKMLDLNEDSRIHMIGVHLHPFAEKLALWDITTDSLLYKSTVIKDTANFSFEKISYFKDEKGIPVYKEHNYELRSTYNCSDSSAVHTAMAVMYLYLVDH